MEFSQDLFVGFFLGYILRSILVHFIVRFRGALVLIQAEKISLQALSDADILFKHAKKWTSIVSESLEEVLKGVRYKLLTQFSVEEVDEIMEEWDMSFIDHNENIWLKTEEMRQRARSLSLKSISTRMKTYGHVVKWTDWESAMTQIADEEKHEAKV
jgi:hypothetical protein